MPGSCYQIPSADSVVRAKSSQSVGRDAHILVGAYRAHSGALRGPTTSPKDSTLKWKCFRAARMGRNVENYYMRVLYGAVGTV